MQKKATFVVKNDRGLHTRPATEFVKLASKYKCDLRLKFRKMEVNGKSLLGILMLAATKGSKLRLEATGIDAEEALHDLVGLANNQFNNSY